MATSKTMTLGELKQAISYAERHIGCTDDSVVYVWDREGEEFFAVKEFVPDNAGSPAIEIHMDGETDDYQPEGT